MVTGVPIYEIETNGVYMSRSGARFKVIHLAKYGLNCSSPMVVYTNLEATFDRPAGEIWVLEESLFLKSFREFRK